MNTKRVRLNFGTNLIASDDLYCFCAAWGVALKGRVIIVGDDGETLTKRKRKIACRKKRQTQEGLKYFALPSL